MTRPRRALAPIISAAAGTAVLLGVLALLTGSGAVAAAAGVLSAAVAMAAASTLPRRRLGGTRGTTAPVAEVVERPRPVARPMPPAPDPPVPAPATLDDHGLLGEEFLRTTLRHRVAVARRALRPVSLLCFEVLELDETSGKRPVAVDVVAGVLRSVVREADTTGLIAESCFACILEDTGEDGAVWAAERIRRGLADADPGRRFRAGIASYPNHGLDATELETKAWSALEAARHWARDRIEVAVTGQ